MSKYVTRDMDKPSRPLWTLPVSLTPSERAERLAQILRTAEEVAIERATNPVEDEPPPVNKKKRKKLNLNKEQALIRRKQMRSKASVARIKRKVEAMSPTERAAYQADVREKRRAREAARTEEQRTIDRAKQLVRERKRYKKRSEMTEEELAAVRAKDKSRNRKRRPK